LAYAVPARATQGKSSFHKSHPSSTRNILDSSNVNIILEIMNEEKFFRHIISEI
jgi:hypothetical protein